MFLNRVRIYYFLDWICYVLRLGKYRTRCSEWVAAAERGRPYYDCQVRCGGCNSKNLGGNYLCFHCDLCGYVECNI